jgi:hypothetical protein
MKKYSSRILEDREENVTMNIEITCRPHQAEELKRLLFAMDAAGSMGCSRTFKCYVDGDGGFRPKVTIDEMTAKDFETEKPVDFEQDTIEFGFE